ncbi:SAM [Musa troglodytarum]|uniref:SAM n=1 Tax=Musa troglodytarum TaxID=320322 RepID=A0A9E7J9T4_9LILI|nr:SAM [Musa troglodytarum]
MYADQIASGRKRSIRERLHGDLGGDVGRSGVVAAKRQRQSDDKWKHDLYEDNTGLEKSVDPNDLRWKLQKKSSQQAYRSGKVSVVRDLRDKLAGTMHSQPSNTDPSKARRVSEISETIKKNIRHDPPVSEAKKPTKSSSTKPSQHKSELSVDGFLHSLGLEKYLITFQAEEIDMAALKHMNDEDLRALGIPMGPRKKILLALESKA